MITVTTITTIWHRQPRRPNSRLRILLGVVTNSNYINYPRYVCGYITYAKMNDDR